MATIPTKPQTNTKTSDKGTSTMTSDYPATGELASHPTGADNAVLLRGVLIYGEGDKQDVLVQDGVIACLLYTSDAADE